MKAAVKGLDKHEKYIGVDGPGQRWFGWLTECEMTRTQVNQHLTAMKVNTRGWYAVGGMLVNSDGQVQVKQIGRD